MGKVVKFAGRILRRVKKLVWFSLRQFIVWDGVQWICISIVSIVQREGCGMRKSRLSRWLPLAQSVCISDGHLLSLAHSWYCLLATIDCYVGSHRQLLRCENVYLTLYFHAREVCRVSFITYFVSKSQPFYSVHTIDLWKWLVRQFWCRTIQTIVKHNRPLNQDW